MPNTPSADRLIRDWNTLPARLLDVRFKSLEEKESFHFGGYSSAVFVLLSRGKGHMVLGNTSYSFDGASVIHVSCRSELEVTAEQETELYLFNYWFLGKDPEAINEPPNESADIVFVPSDLLELKHSFDLLLEQWHRLGALNQLRLTSNLYELVHLLLRQQQESYKNQSPNTADQRVLRALRYMIGHLSQTATLTEVAEAAGCGTRRLTQLFRERFDCSPLQVWIRIRMEQAKQDVKGTSATLQHIAEQVGYANAYSFSRQFKQSYGLSPEQYRRSDARITKPRDSESMTSLASARLLSDLQAAKHRENEKNRAPANPVQTKQCSPIQGAPTILIPEPTRIVHTRMGKIEVPVRPRRIVADWSIGHLLALGEQPIGAPSTLLDNGGLLDAYWKGTPADIGRHNEISYERIVELEPDLILTWNPQAYASYARIAPTLVFEADHCKGMEDEMRMIGEFIGRKKEAAAWIRQARLRTHSLRNRLAERFAKPTTFTLADPYWCGAQVTLIGNAAYRGGRAVYDRLNLSSPSSLRHMLTSSGQDSARVNEPELEVNLGEWVLVMNYDASHNLTSAPQWNRESIAQRHRIVDLPWNRYFQSDPLSSLLQAEELTHMLDRPFSPF